MSDTWIQSYSGQQVFLPEPDPDSILIEDIAHSLSQLCRFGGHPPYLYSVAQHSVYVAERCPNFPREGLMHDAHESPLTADLSRPVASLPELGEGWKLLKNKVQKPIAKKFGLIFPTPGEVKLVDDRMLLTEAKQLMDKGLLHKWGFPDDLEPFDDLKIEYWSVSYTKHRFLTLWRKLTREKK